LIWEDPPVPGLLYETHVTVRCAGPAETERLRGWAEAAGLKVTHIVLARGRMRDQPMLTLAGPASYAEQSARADRTVAALRSAGFAPVRVKTESVPGAPEVPDGPCGGGQYFEHHVKLLLDAETDLASLAARVVPHGAHLSWNARGVCGGGRHERFVTQRCRGVRDAEAEEALRLLLSELGGFEVLCVEREFVLYDSDESVDDGWIEEPMVQGVRG